MTRAPDTSPCDDAPGRDSDGRCRAVRARRAARGLGAGSAWPLPDRDALADAVIGAAEVPSAAACFAVSGALAAAGTLVAGRPGGKHPVIRRSVPPRSSPSWPGAAYSAWPAVPGWCRPPRHRRGSRGWTGACTPRCASGWPAYQRCPCCPRGPSGPCCETVIMQNKRDASTAGSAGSLLSIGSSGSILSIGSSGSILSIGSAGSILSIGSAGWWLRCSRSARRRARARYCPASRICRSWPGGPAGPSGEGGRHDVGEQAVYLVTGIPAAGQRPAFPAL